MQGRSLPGRASEHRILLTLAFVQTPGGDSLWLNQAPGEAMAKLRASGPSLWQKSPHCLVEALVKSLCLA